MQTSAKNAFSVCLNPSLLWSYWIFFSHERPFLFQIGPFQFQFFCSRPSLIVIWVSFQRINKPTNPRRPRNYKLIAWPKKLQIVAFPFSMHCSKRLSGILVKQTICDLVKKGRNKFGHWYWVLMAYNPQPLSKNARKKMFISSYWCLP